MRHNLLFAILGSFLLSFFLNFFSHHNLVVSFVNSFTLVLSIYLFRNYLTLKSVFSLFLIISLGLVPFFSYKPNNSIFALLPLFSLSILGLYNRYPKKMVVIFYFIFLLIGNLFSGEIIKYPFDIQYSQLIFNSPEINYHIQRHQQDALFIPFKLRQVIYSESVFIYAGLTNLFDLINLKNISEILLLANTYPFFLGIYKIFVKKNKLRNIIIISFLATIITTSVDRSADRFQSPYLLSPIFIYLILLGAQGINRKIYLALFTLSFFILISPKI